MKSSIILLQSVLKCKEKELRNKTDEKGSAKKRRSFEIKFKFIWNCLHQISTILGILLA